MAKRSGIFIGIPNRGPSAAEFWVHLRRVEQHFPPGIIYTYGDPRRWLRKPIPEARTLIVHQAQAKNHEWLLLLDDDVMPPRSLLTALMGHDDPIVTGVYWSKTVPSEPIIFKNKGEGCYTDWKIGDYFDVWAAGLGCCMIKMEVFDEIPEPWFLWDYSRTEGDTVTFVPQGEDYYFFEKAGEFGFPVMCDTRVQCDHIEPISGSIFPGIDVVGEVYGITKDMLRQWRKDPDSVPTIPPAITEQIEANKELISERRYQLFETVPGEKLAVGQVPVEPGFVSVGSTEDNDIVCDLDIDRLPLAANVVGAIAMRFSFEYFNDPVKVMEELWRVCKNGAIVEVVSTYASSSRALGNPYTRTFVNEASFVCYSKDARESMNMPWSPNCNFETISIEHIPENDFLGKGERDIQFAARCYMNSVQHVRVVLKAVK